MHYHQDRSANATGVRLRFEHDQEGLGRRDDGRALPRRRAATVYALSEQSSLIF